MAAMQVNEHFTRIRNSLPADQQLIMNKLSQDLQNGTISQDEFVAQVALVVNTKRRLSGAGLPSAKKVKVGAVGTPVKDQKEKVLYLSLSINGFIY